MSQGMLRLNQSTIDAEVGKSILGMLSTQLKDAKAGQCLRVCDLPLSTMTAICKEIRIAFPGFNAFVLSENIEAINSEDVSLYATGTRIVELRNPDCDGTIRPPLIVFVPNQLRASSEDSFGVATFREINLNKTYQDISDALATAVPNGRSRIVKEIINILSQEKWDWFDHISLVRYLLTIREHDYDQEVLGAALFEFGLLPDFKLLENSDIIAQRIMRNCSYVKQIHTSITSPILRAFELVPPLTDIAFKKKLGTFLGYATFENPVAWCSSIALEKTNWHLSFDKWPLPDSLSNKKEICIAVTELDIPEVSPTTKDPRLEPLIGQQVLAINEASRAKFSIDFQVTPDLSKVPGVKKFRIEVVSKETLSVKIARNKAAWAGSRNHARISFVRLHRYDWEEGWYFIRVLPFDENDDLLPLVDHSGNPISWRSSTQKDGLPTNLNESDLFYILPAENVDIEVSQRAVPRFATAAHALIDAKFKAAIEDRDLSSICIRNGTWVHRNQRGQLQAKQIDYEIRFAHSPTVRIPVSETLRNIETKILEHADGPIDWNLTIRLGDVSDLNPTIISWPQIDGIGSFLTNRKKYFEALRGEGNEGLITQCIDPYLFKEIAVDYAISYTAIIEKIHRKLESATDTEQQILLVALHTLLNIDTVNIKLTMPRGGEKKAILIAPTHPLRVLWLIGWRNLSEEWAAKIATQKNLVNATKSSLLDGISLLNYPPVIVATDNSFVVCIDNINPFWTLYAPASEEDPKGLTGVICSAFGLPEPIGAGSSTSALALVDRVQRYLNQHPYVSELSINVFNGGRGGLIADLLLQLQRQKRFSSLRYNLRFFIHDPEEQTFAEQISALLSPDATQSSPEVDAFCSPGPSHLLPKLRYATLPLSEFMKCSTQYSAHISVLFDLFPPEEVGAEELPIESQSSPLHGLYQDFCTIFTDTENSATWKQLPRHGLPIQISDNDEISIVISRLSFLFSRSCASITTMQTGVKTVPVLRLVLKGPRRELLHNIHQMSDWVFSLDRYLGIEFYDHNKYGQRPDYLIDYESNSIRAGRRLVLSSRSITEVERLLKQAVEAHNIPATEGLLVSILDQLRTLSGKLPLRLLSGSTQRSEVIGLALAKLYLQWQGALSNQIVMPLDSHQDLFHTTVDDSLHKRTDLALFDLSANTKTIVCRLVEVKCYSDASVSVFQALKENILTQLRNTEKVLKDHFDPLLRKPDRPDRVVKTLEFVNFIEFYLDRAIRFGLMTENAYTEAKYMLRSLEQGYSLVFTHSALIFDFSKPKSDSVIIEDGIEYYRIGCDCVEDLLNTLRPADVKLTDPFDYELKPSTESRRIVDTSNLTKLLKTPTAAFISPKRDRTVTWDYLQERLLTHGSITARETVLEDKYVELPEKTTDVSLVLANDNIDNLTDISPENKFISNASIDSNIGFPVVAPPCDIFLGTTGPTPQYGIIGEVAGRQVGLDLNQTHTISLFGVQGSGKSYTLGSIVEMATTTIAGINELPKPLCTVIFHYSPTQDYQPEFTSMIKANDVETEIKILKEKYKAAPQSLNDTVLLCPRDKLIQRKSEFLDLEVAPLVFAASDLDVSHWMFLMGAVGSQATYIRQIKQIFREIRNDLTLQNLENAIEYSPMPDNLKTLAKTRLHLASAYIDDRRSLKSIAKPGRLIIVDLRDELIEKDEALGLFVVLLQIFADTKYQEKHFNKLVVFDEAHKYIENPDLIAGLIETVREMRHKGTSILVASQDPPSVPISLIELSSQIILHRFNSPAWLKHIQKANASLAELNPQRMAHLAPGEAYIWSSKATEPSFSNGVVKINLRPRVTKHGGTTKTAL